MLVVDDYPDVRESYVRLCRAHGWDVQGVATIAEATRALENDPPDCMILDLKLSDGRGETLLDLVRDRGLTTCAIVVTGLGDLALLESIRQCYNPAGVFLKPADPLEVMEVCAQARHRGPDA
jgi:FixJ family two-component response regulator